MPLRAFVDGQEIIAPLLDDAAWDALRQRVADEHLRVTLPCCEVEGYLRRSKAGTQHFAHKQGAKQDANCTVKAETVEHLRAKADIILACHAAGFAASTEVAGDDWRADVLATHDSKNGLIKIAFEVQWSFLRLNDALHRQRRYARDGIRGCWFFRRPPAPLHRDFADPGPNKGSYLEARQDLPLFHLYANATGSFSVTLNGRLHPLPDFVTALLQGRVRFCESATTGPNLSLRLLLSEVACPHCRRYSHIYEVDATQTAACGVWFTPDIPINADHPTLLSALQQYLSTPSGSSLHLAPIRQCPDPAFVCPACDTPLRSLIDTQPYTSARTLQPMTTLDLTLPTPTRTPVTGPAPHWCYPDNNGSFCCPQP